MDRGLGTPRVDFSLCARDIDPSPKMQQLLSAPQFSSTRPHFLSDRGGDTGGEMPVLLTEAGPGYLLGFQGLDQNEMPVVAADQEMPRLSENSRIIAQTLLTDVQRHSLLLSEAPGQALQQSSHQTNY